MKSIRQALQSVQRANGSGDLKGAVSVSTLRKERMQYKEQVQLLKAIKGARRSKKAAAEVLKHVI